MDRFCDNIFFLKKPNIPEYVKVLVVTWAKRNPVTTLLSPRPTTGGNILRRGGLEIFGQRLLSLHEMYEEV